MATYTRRTTCLAFRSTDVIDDARCLLRDADAVESAIAFS